MARPTLSVRDLLALCGGHLLTLDYRVEWSVELRVNGTRKYTVQVVSTGRKRGCVIEQIHLVPPQGRISDEVEEPDGDDSTE